jgi:ADP-heptose:LPS heptosyltransferase
MFKREVSALVRFLDWRAMFPLRIQIKKNADGSTAITCTRADGSVTWQRNEGGKARFFVRHDLTHYAVESVLQHRRGFYGLVAEGWNFTDFGAPWPRGKIPADADPAELIVGFFDAQAGSGERWSAAEFDEHARRFLEQHGAAMPKGSLIKEEQVQQIRLELRELLRRWEAVKVGGKMELEFDPE